MSKPLTVRATDSARTLSRTADNRRPLSYQRLPALPQKLIPSTTDITPSIVVFRRPQRKQNRTFYRPVFNDKNIYNNKEYNVRPGSHSASFFTEGRKYKSGLSEGIQGGGRKHTAQSHSLFRHEISSPCRVVFSEGRKNTSRFSQGPYLGAINSTKNFWSMGTGTLCRSGREKSHREKRGKRTRAKLPLSALLFICFYLRTNRILLVYSSPWRRFSLSLPLPSRRFTLSLSPPCLVSFFSPRRTVYLPEFQNATSIIPWPGPRYRSLVFKSYEDIEHPLWLSLPGLTANCGRIRATASRTAPLPCLSPSKLTYWRRYTPELRALRGRWEDRHLPREGLDLYYYVMWLSLDGISKHSNLWVSIK